MAALGMVRFCALLICLPVRIATHATDFAFVQKKAVILPNTQKTTEAIALDGVQPYNAIQGHPAPAPPPEEEDSDASENVDEHGVSGTPEGVQDQTMVMLMSFAGTAVGASCGAFIGGIAWGGPEAWFGAVAGGFFGGVVGWAGGYGSIVDDDSTPSEMIEPYTEKLQRLSDTLVAITTMLNNDDNLMKAQHAKYEADTKEMRRILAHIQAEIDAGVPASADDFHEIEEILSHEDYSVYLSAEAAISGEEALTAHEVSLIEGLENTEQAEDLGPGGDLPSHEGDMVPENPDQLLLFQSISKLRQTANLSAGAGPFAGTPWTGGFIKYCFASDVSVAVKHLFAAAVNDISTALPCLRFKNVGLESGHSYSDASQQRCKSSGPAIFVQSNKKEGCYSYVGMIGHWASQRLQLQDPGCMSIGTAVHEIGHALGMAHEQARPDRDNYVRIDMKNVKAGFGHNFKIEPNGFTKVRYDYTSVMHYDAFAFAKDKSKPTIYDKKNPGHSANELGQRIGLSNQDIEQLVAMYTGTAKGGCAATTVGKLGCIDKPADDGSDFCGKLKKCSAKAISKCCGCGGGTKVQCYQGKPCPSPKKLPAPEGGDCIQDKSKMFPPGSGCVFTNACSFSVKWKCPGLSCEHTTGPGGFWTQSCGGTPQTDICKPGVCSVFKA
eukprot:TRINITY_DN13155_c0_g1_i1.p1 TRINITY_DN13155_c0_g1~~TRINITY_DN13155_c0_g1_i1.p1  ORF type:complete len:665 (-),score=104.24 TRINITY_DN13155_c0_g1_i1:46-2040(-)